MNPDRKKSIIALLGTLILGILLGLLIPRAFHTFNQRDRSNFRSQQHARMHKNRWFVGTLNNVIKPDSLQSEKIKPITDWAAVKIDSIERSADQQMSAVLDSVNNKVLPFISEEQKRRLDEFNLRAKQRWQRGGRKNMDRQ